MSGLDADAFSSGFASGMGAIDEHRLRQAQLTETQQRGDYYNQLGAYRDQEATNQQRRQRTEDQQKQDAIDKQNRAQAFLGAINYVNEAAKAHGMTPEQFQQALPTMPEHQQALQGILAPAFKGTPYENHPEMLFSPQAQQTAANALAMHNNPDTQFTPQEQGAMANTLLPEAQNAVGKTDHHGGTITSTQVIRQAGVPPGYPPARTFMVQHQSEDEDGNPYTHTKPFNNSDDPEKVTMVPHDTMTARATGLGLLLSGLHGAGTEAGIPNLLPILHAAYLTQGGNPASLNPPSVKAPKDLREVKSGSSILTQEYDSGSGAWKTIATAPREVAKPKEPGTSKISPADLTSGLSAIHDQILGDAGITYDPEDKSYVGADGKAVAPVDLAKVNAEIARTKLDANQMAAQGDTEFTAKALAAHAQRAGAAPKPAPAPAPAGATGGLPNIKTKADYDKLAPGAQYIAPDGTTRTKKS